MMKKISILSLIFLLMIIQAGRINAQTKNDYLTGNWSGTRDSLKNKGVVFKPRLTFFQQNFVSGTGSKESVFSGKADLKMILNGKIIGLNHLTLITQIEQNFGNNLFGTGGVIIPKNTAISFPGIQGADSFDMSSFYFVYKLSKDNSILFGKINAIDLATSSRFSGGAGIDGFWNMNFSAPISGIMPPYIFGSIATLHSELLKYTIMIYDPISVVNRSGLESPFSRGITFSLGVEKQVKIANKTEPML